MEKQQRTVIPMEQIENTIQRRRKFKDISHTPSNEQDQPEENLFERCVK